MSRVAGFYLLLSAAKNLRSLNRIYETVLILDFRLKLSPTQARDESISRVGESFSARRKPPCPDGHEASDGSATVVQKISEARRAPLAAEAPGLRWGTGVLVRASRTGRCFIAIRFRCCIVCGSS